MKYGIRYEPCDRDNNSIAPGRSFTQCRAKFDITTSCEFGARLCGLKFSSSSTMRSTSTVDKSQIYEGLLVDDKLYDRVETTYHHIPPLHLEIADPLLDPKERKSACIGIRTRK